MILQSFTRKDFPKHAIRCRRNYVLVYFNTLLQLSFSPVSDHLRFLNIRLVILSKLRILLPPFLSTGVVGFLINLVWSGKGESGKEEILGKINTEFYQRQTSVERQENDGKGSI